MKLLLLFAFLALLTTVWTTWRYGIGPTPTSPKVKRGVIRLFPKKIDGTIYELGAGFGTLAFAAADHYPKNQVVAIEVSPLPWAWLHLRQLFAYRPNLSIQYGDLFQLPINGAGLVLCYLYPGAMPGLKTKIEKESAQAQVITHTFAIPGWHPDQTIKAGDIYETPIYLYSSHAKN